ncbi:threonine-phosphate decarboxylase [Psychromonas sp. L1A2]|uniref:threonine-phosphate decarboxylase n=1 Tax=Psychromonas sp. L1A2 TaxID=2686356 RepID=UPI00135B47A4|nr:threonine-phosphate decarboxylase [Psychromonas sp. L1A2]
MAILHGGQLSRVATQYQIPENEWLDLSTGIAPFSYGIPVIPAKAWQDLPTISSSLIEAAKHYYHADFCWPVAGSQQLIEKLPELWTEKLNEKLNQRESEKYDVKNNRVENAEIKHAYLPKVGYKEHQQAWSKAGYQLHFYQQCLPGNIEKNSIVVVINPNNPLTDTFTVSQLLSLKKHCEQQQALLIIDEAFADIFAPAFSFIPHIINHQLAHNDVIVLRSFGKFFGLAGVRIGFACSTQAWCETIKNSIGPWSINGPALFIAEQALQDKQWQVEQNKRLDQQSHIMQQLLKTYLPSARVEANALFITVFLINAPVVYEQLCQQAVYVRLTDENNALRFGLTDKVNTQRLSDALATIV